MKPGTEQRPAELPARKERAARVAIATTGTLVVLKVATAVITGSLGILADATHSLIDFTGAVVGFFGVKVADQPPDEEHRFGHGRAEDIASATIATLIFVAAGIIAYQAVTRLIAGAVVHMVEVGIVATALAIVINVVVSRYVLGTAQAVDSIALEATGRDLMADVLSSIAVLAGLALVQLTDNATMDPIVALVVVILIARSAYHTIHKATDNLMDRKLPEDEEYLICRAVEARTEIANYHALRTRKAGSERHIQLHIVVSPEKTVGDGHQIAEEMEDEIRALFPGSVVTIHVEPCTPDCSECPVPCKAARRTNIRR